MDQDEYNESVSPVRGKPVKRGKAQDCKRRLNLVCATFPIIGKNKIVELKRSSEKRILGGKWVCFLSEHSKPEDHTSLNTLRRGVREEVGYNFRRNFYDPRDTLDVSYSHEYESFFWAVSLFVVPIRSLYQLIPDEKEIIDIRERDMDEVFRESKKKDSIYHEFKPIYFMNRLERYTRHITNNKRKH